MQAWVLAVMVVVALAGCAEQPSEKLITSSQAVDAARLYLENRHEDAVLVGLQSYEGKLDESTVEWLEETGFRSDAPHGDLMDGRSGMWIARFALPNGPGATPHYLILQVTADEVREKLHPGRILKGPGGGAGHHSPDDICFTARGNTTVTDLDILHDVADSPAIAAALRQDPRLASFMPDVERIRLSLEGARTSYGLLPEYWCWEREQQWRFTADDGDNGTFRGVFTMQGDLVATLDWRNGAGSSSSTATHLVTDGPLAVGQTFRHEFPLEVPSDVLRFWTLISVDEGRGAENLRLELLRPDGTVVGEDTGRDMELFEADYPVAGTWTIRYSYTATLPLSQHEIDVDLRTYGPL